MAKFKVGDKVMWVFGKSSDTGVIVRQGYKVPSFWLIKWDSDGSTVPAFEENLSLLEERNTPWYETEEGKQWLSEQMDVEEAFNKSQDNITYSIGQRFKVFYEEGCYWDCILAQVGADVVCLIDLESGNRIYEPVHVFDSYKITEDEMKMIAGDCSFHLL